MAEIHPAEIRPAEIHRPEVKFENIFIAEIRLDIRMFLPPFIPVRDTLFEFSEMRFACHVVYTYSVRLFKTIAGWSEEGKENRWISGLKVKGLKKVHTAEPAEI